MEKIEKKAMEDLEFVACAWGYGLTTGDELVRFNGTSPGGLSETTLVPVIKLPVTDAVAVETELQAVSVDRFAPWPTVEKFRPYLKDH